MTNNKKKSDAVFEEYMAQVLKTKNKPLSRFNLPTPDHEETPLELVTEGLRILEQEEKPFSKIVDMAPKTSTPTPDQTKELESKLASISNNPYVRARNEILDGLKEDTRKMILRMEAGKMEKNSQYDDFIKSIHRRGDQLSANN